MTQQASTSTAPDGFRPPQPLIAGRPYFIASLIPLAAGLSEITPPLASLVVGAAIALLGALRSGWALRERRSLRMLADNQIVEGARPTSTPLLTWRASDLVSSRNRRILARTLRSIEAEAVEPRVPTSSPINRRGIRPHLDVVHALAAKVGALDEPVNPRGMVLVERLICNGFGPLYLRDRAAQLRAELERCLSALEPPHDDEPGSREQSRVARSPWTAAPARRPSQVVVRHRGRR